MSEEKRWSVVFHNDSLGVDGSVVVLAHTKKSARHTGKKKVTGLLKHSSFRVLDVHLVGQGEGVSND